MRGDRHNAPRSGLSPMATATPPRAPRTPPPPPAARAPRRPVTTAPRPRPLRWLLGAAALAVLALIVYAAVSGPEATEYRVLFDSAELLDPGDHVEVGGVPVGTVKKIVLTSDYKARVAIEVESPLAPLHRGTTAEIRYPSLSGVANRYIELGPGPNNYPTLPAGATIPASATRSPVDLDELLGALNGPTRRGLQMVIQGFAEQYAGAEGDVHTAIHYFAPSLRALERVFSELTCDERTFTEFLVQGARATTTIAAHSEALTSLIGNAELTFRALGARQQSLARGLHELPATFTSGTRAFTELHAPLTALRRLVDVSKPDTRTLPLLLERLRPLLSEGTPVINNLSLAISRPGPNNDFTDAALELPALAKTLESASPHTVRAERESIPNTAFFGPYSPDLGGLIRDFGQSTAYYDANGHYAHVMPVFDSFKLGEGNTLTPVTPQQGLEGLTTGQLRRCPGAATQPPADGSAPFADSGLLGCIASEVP
jgi:phospholipid/cholesterol/gamma-HCH transport system substrate-binding protein